MLNQLNIIFYFKGTAYKGLIIEPYHNLQVDCYIDTGFYGLWGVEEYWNPLCIKFRTGSIIKFM